MATRKGATSRLTRRPAGPNVEYVCLVLLLASSYLFSVDHPSLSSPIQPSPAIFVERLANLVLLLPAQSQRHCRIQ